MNSWKPQVLYRPNDPDGFPYHAYAVSHMRVHVREGRYPSEFAARACATSLANSYNTHEVDPCKPHGVDPVQVLFNQPEQGDKPWIRGCFHVEDMTPDEARDFHQRVLERFQKDARIIDAAVEVWGGVPNDYFVIDDKAWPKTHEAGGPQCPFGKGQCGYCHKGCDDPFCGICEDRAICSVFPQPVDEEEDDE